jgi:hypothetical protein
MRKHEGTRSGQDSSGEPSYCTLSPASTKSGAKTKRAGRLGPPIGELEVHASPLATGWEIAS